MKQGRSLQDLAIEIDRQRNAKKDYVASTEHMAVALTEELTRAFEPAEKAPRKGSKKETARKAATRERAPILPAGPVAMTIGAGTDKAIHVGINDLAHQQIAEHTGIPVRYYGKMRAEAPGLLADNINEWFRKYPMPRMARTMDNSLRAFLSDRYRPLENGDLAEAVLPPLSELGVEIMSCEITERRLYIKAVDARINRDIPSGRKMGDGTHTVFDTVSPAIVISNSEVGLGALNVETGVWTRACTNLAIFGQRSMRKYHIGGKQEITDGIYAMLSDKTRRLTDAALWMQVRDIVKGAFDQARFDASLEDVKEMAEQPIAGDPVKVVEMTAKKFDLGETTRKSVLTHLIKGGDLSRYGLWSALTRAAEDEADYDDATSLERLGGKLIELPQGEWRQLAEAA